MEIVVMTYNATEAESQCQAYLKLRKAEGLKPTTLKNYRNGLGCIFRFLERKDIGLRQLEPDDLTDWVNEMRDSELSERTLNLYQVQVRCFLRWMLTGRTKGEFPELVRHLKIVAPQSLEPLQENAKIPPELYNRLLDEARKVNKDLPVYIAILYDTGARRGELLSVKKKHIIPNGKATYLEVRGKTGYRKVPLAMSLPFVKAHLQMMNGDPEAYLFPGKFGGHASATYFSNPFRAIIKRLKADGVIPAGQRLTFHSFRHNRATIYGIRHRWSNPLLETLFGWSRGSDMPSRYCHVDVDDVAIAVEVAQGLRDPEDTSSFSETVDCPNCEHPVPLAVRFCGSCGHALDVSDQSEIDFLKKKLDELGEDALTMWQAGQDALTLVNNPSFRAFMETIKMSPEAKAELG
jgi:integrase